MKRRGPYPALVAALLVACGSPAAAPLLAREVQVTAPRPGTTMSAGYLELVNPGAAPVTIDKVRSPQYASVAMHETVVQDGIARMRPVPEVVIGAGETLRFEQGARHLMLMQPRSATPTVTLEFWSGEILLLSVEAPVTDAVH